MNLGADIEENYDDEYNKYNYHETKIDKAKLFNLTEKADILLSSKNYTKAIEIYEKCIMLFIKLFGQETKDFKDFIHQLITRLNSISLELINDGESSLLQTAYKILKKCEEFTDPSEYSNFPSLRVLTFNHLACCLRRKNNLKSALRYLENAFKIMNWTSVNEYYGMTNLNICALYSQLNNHEKALEHARNAVFEFSHTVLGLNPANFKNEEEYAIAFAENIRFLAISYYDLGVEEEHFNNFENGINAYEKAYKLIEENIGPNDPSCEKFKEQYQVLKEKYFASEYKKLKKQSEGKAKISSLRNRPNSPSSSGTALQDSKMYKTNLKEVMKSPYNSLLSTNTPKPLLLNQKDKRLHMFKTQPKTIKSSKNFQIQHYSEASNTNLNQKFYSRPQTGIQVDDGIRFNRPMTTVHKKNNGGSFAERRPFFSTAKNSQKVHEELGDSDIYRLEDEGLLTWDSEKEELELEQRVMKVPNAKNTKVERAGFLKSNRLVFLNSLINYSEKNKNSGKFSHSRLEMMSNHMHENQENKRKISSAYPKTNEYVEDRMVSRSQVQSNYAIKTPKNDIKEEKNKNFHKKENSKDSKSLKSPFNNSVNASDFKKDQKIHSEISNEYKKPNFAWEMPQQNVRASKKMPENNQVPYSSKNTKENIQITNEKDDELNGSLKLDESAKVIQRSWRKKQKTNEFKNKKNQLIVQNTVNVLSVSQRLKSYKNTELKDNLVYSINIYLDKINMNLHFTATSKELPVPLSYALKLQAVFDDYIDPETNCIKNDKIGFCLEKSKEIAKRFVKMLLIQDGLLTVENRAAIQTLLDDMDYSVNKNPSKKKKKSFQIEASQPIQKDADFRDYVIEDHQPPSTERNRNSSLVTKSASKSENKINESEKKLPINEPDKKLSKNEAEKNNFGNELDKKKVVNESEKSSSESLTKKKKFQEDFDDSGSIHIINNFNETTLAEMVGNETALTIEPLIDHQVETLFKFIIKHSSGEYLFIVTHDEDSQELHIQYKDKNSNEAFQSLYATFEELEIEKVEKNSEFYEKLSEIIFHKVAYVDSLKKFKWNSGARQVEDSLMNRPGDGKFSDPSSKREKEWKNINIKVAPDEMDQIKETKNFNKKENTNENISFSNIPENDVAARHQNKWQNNVPIIMEVREDEEKMTKQTVQSDDESQAVKLKYNSLPNENEVNYIDLKNVKQSQSSTPQMNKTNENEDNSVRTFKTFNTFGMVETEDEIEKLKNQINENPEQYNNAASKLQGKWREKKKKDPDHHKELEPINASDENDEIEILKRRIQENPDQFNDAANKLQGKWKAKKKKIKKLKLILRKMKFHLLLQ